MKTDAFATLVQRFFADYVAVQRGLSPHTARSYRQSFRLLLIFLSALHNKPVDHLTFDEFSPEAILKFLDHLERSRNNTVGTRNGRLAAIRSFARFVLGQSAPDFVATTQRILAIPSKRRVKPVLGFLTRPELSAVIDAIDTSTRSGRRDHLFFSLLYNTAARVSEMLQLRVCDIQNRAVHLQGKGRRNRLVPVWPQNYRCLRQWCQANQLTTDQRLFTNRQGLPLTREGIAFRLRLALGKAEKTCASLRQRRITPHTFRHAAGMHLLQSGVPLEIIALWMGHSSPATTHGYLEADLKMKQDCLRQLRNPSAARRGKERSPAFSHLIAFLETK
jgi:site-specific recombinase XerD